MICLFPNLAAMPKVKRRALMLLVWPLVLVETNINFAVSFYQCWAQEH